MDYVVRSRVHDFVVVTLRQLGVANPRLDAINMRILTKDGCYAGQVAQCEHIRVLFSTDGQIIHFFGPGDVLLKKIGVGQIAALCLMVSATYLFFFFFLSFFFLFFSFSHRFVHLPSTHRGHGMGNSPICL